MIFIYLIIFIIAIDGTVMENSSLNRVILVASCQANKSGLESIPRPTDRPYYFHLFTQSSSSLSSSSPVLPLLHLSYCEDQQATYHSSSGFAILRSSPRLPLTGIVDQKSSSSFHHHNAVLSAIDQSSSTSSSIVTLMSSSNRNNVLVDTDNNKLISSTTFSNVSLLHTSLSTITTQKGNRTFNITLLIGCISMGIIIMIIIYAIVKYYNRDEGSYKIDESNNFTAKSLVDKKDNDSCIGKMSSSSHHRQKLLTTDEQNIGDSREWYV